MGFLAFSIQIGGFPEIAQQERNKPVAEKATDPAKICKLEPQRKLEFVWHEQWSEELRRQGIRSKDTMRKKDLATANQI